MVLVIKSVVVAIFPDNTKLKGLVKVKAVIHLEA
jgi:hypothetical protein